jgi:hypothetical protein
MSFGNRDERVIQRLKQVPADEAKPLMEILALIKRLPFRVAETMPEMTTFLPQSRVLKRMKVEDDIERLRPEGQIE